MLCLELTGTKIRRGPRVARREIAIQEILDPTLLDEEGQRIRGRASKETAELALTGEKLS